MPVKTITIDMEAYGLLAANKREKESFSKVIRRHFGASSSTAKRLLDNLGEVCLSDDALDAAEELVKARENSMPDSPVFDKK